MARSRANPAQPTLLSSTELRTAPVAAVALLAPIDRHYSYRVPDELEGRIMPGMRVTVPFGRGNRPATAFCLSVSDQPWDSTLKPILDAVDGAPLLNESLLELGRWIARYYAAPLGRTLDLMVPAAAKSRAGWKKIPYATLAPGAQRSGETFTAKQTAVLEALAAAGGTAPIEACCNAADCRSGVVRTLQKRGVVTIETRHMPIAPKDSGSQRQEPDYELNPDQRTAVACLYKALEARRFSVQVLYGVTGSGKTECYIATMHRALSEGRQAILLVPEIALTTQTVQRLSARFDRVATIHSGLTGVERSRTWAAVAAGDIPVVIGTRSAVFAPCPDLGVIIVDEEAEGGYKNLASPRFHTRDVAIKRAHIQGIPVVLGSATPSLETWANIQRRKHYHLLRLPSRVRGLAMPTVHLVDMREEHRARRGVHLLSRAMEEHLQRTLDRREQAVLLLNRRGYAGFLHCPRCQTAVTCPRCSVRMVLHATTELAHCHYCRARLAVPRLCQMAGCGGTLVHFGIGTQRVEAELRRKFPEARLHRFDSDIMQRAADYAEVLGAFERKECDILVGTQMVAKGLDFPFVSFVGVVSADTALALDDFRSEERTFQLVLQVAGRSGRGDVGGQVVVQTFAADTAPIRHAVDGDYEGFAKEELLKRRRTRLPPFTRIVRIILSDAKMTRLRKAADDLSRSIEETLQKAGIKARLFGPHPAPMLRMKDMYRYDVQLVFDTPGAMMSALDRLKSEGTLKARVRSLIVDVDPISLQ